MTGAMLAAACLAGAAGSGQAQEPVYFGSDDPRVTSTFRAELGVLVEAAGLERWSLEAIEDTLEASGGSLFARSGDQGTVRPLPSVVLAGGVAVSLFGPDVSVPQGRATLDFPQSVLHQSRGDSAVTVFLAVIEDPAMVTVREFEGQGEARTAPWPVLAELAGAPFGVLEAGVRANIRARATDLAPTLSMSTRADSAELTGVWVALGAHRAAEDLATAREVLGTSPNAVDRVAAVAILSNFDEDDEAWHALVGALLDPDTGVREHARAVLRAWASDMPRRVDWVPAAGELRAVLQGSDLVFLPDMLDILVATGAGPDLARPVLANGGHAVLLFAGALNPWARGPAHRFLRAVSGKDGATPAEWREWIATL